MGGLKEYYPKLLDPEVAGSIREVVRKYFAASGNQQADYERVRDMVENIVKQPLYWTLWSILETMSFT